MTGGIEEHVVVKNYCCVRNCRQRISYCCWLFYCGRDWIWLADHRNVAVQSMQAADCV